MRARSECIIWIWTWMCRRLSPDQLGSLCKGNEYGAWKPEMDGVFIPLWVERTCIITKSGSITPQLRNPDTEDTEISGSDIDMFLKSIHRLPPHPPSPLLSGFFPHSPACLSLCLSVSLSLRLSIHPSIPNHSQQGVPIQTHPLMPQSLSQMSRTNTRKKKPHWAHPNPHISGS
jgi:hypothetical protein